MIEATKTPIDDEATRQFWAHQVDEIGRAFATKIQPYLRQLHLDPNQPEVVATVEVLRREHREQIQPAVRTLVAIEAMQPDGVDEVDLLRVDRRQIEAAQAAE
ncbi:hypothetical protein [Beijerinckia sp. L45]|uniref:hypothetical protein n=1 Tax=Beijerinckia sp. L45 TaxID=1641855 RepID=UPI00131C023B|nr:hypothetical protein [Beijerinckia sp. L45]